MNILKKYERFSPIFYAVLFLSFGFVLATFWLGPTYQKFDFLYADFSIDSCMEDFGVTESNFIDEPNRAKHLHTVCYSKIYSQGLLNEYQIRRVNFQNQHVADNIVMWMVVALTFSGVGLAALQISSSVRIFEKNGSDAVFDSTEVSLEKGKIYLKSSVTGLFILLISFAFFYIYILYVYTITDIGGQRKQFQHGQVGSFLVEGGVFSPENSSKENVKPLQSSD